MLQVKHIGALIEMLSMVDDEFLRWLGLTPMERMFLQDAYERLGHNFQNLVGFDHPAFAEADEQADEMVDVASPDVTVAASVLSRMKTKGTA